MWGKNRLSCFVPTQLRSWGPICCIKVKFFTNKLIQGSPWLILRLQLTGLLCTNCHILHLRTKNKTFPRNTWETPANCQEKPSMFVSIMNTSSQDLLKKKKCMWLKKMNHDITSVTSLNLVGSSIRYLPCVYIALSIFTSSSLLSVPTVSCQFSLSISRLITLHVAFYSFHFIELWWLLLIYDQCTS